MELPNKASVIILSYNRLQYYKDALDSVLHQNYSSMELIIADDGSANFDNKLKNYLGMTLEEYIEMHKKGNFTDVKILKNKKNHGTVLNIKNATDICTGKYIFSLSADDAFYDENVIENAIIVMEKQRLAVLICQWAKYSEDFSKFKEYGWPNYFIDLVKNNKRSELLQCSIHSWVFGYMIYTKELYDRLNFFNTPLFIVEDFYRNVLFLQSNVEIGCTEKPLYKYRLSKNSVQRNKDENMKRLVKMECLLTIKLLLQQQLDVFKENWNTVVHGNKKLIVWGTGKAMRMSFGHLMDTFGRIDYLVTNEPRKQGKKYMGINIHPVEKILSENKEGILVLVCSQFYYENDILGWLLSNGFKEGLNALYYHEGIYSLLLL